MKVSLSWLKELVKYNLSDSELAEKLSLSSIGVKSQTPEYLELDLTYNRGDLLSLRGVAREVATITDSKVTFEDKSTPKYNLPKTPVKIEDENLSLVQVVAKIENLKVEQLNDTWVKKLSDSGMRSVNNIVDITNLMMLEYGQPFHSFAAEKIQDETIIVRLAKNGEQITTLDGKQRLLASSDIVLADTKKPLDVAGVMGSKDTEVTNSTNTILLSASMFNPVMIRKTSKRLGLSSEASKRFQHGLTKINLLQALAGAIKMYEGLGGKLTAINMVGNFEDKPRQVTLSQEKINSLLGVDIKPEQVEESLKRLCFKLASHTSSGNVVWEVTVPYWRLDINIEEDLIEEVARMYGYDKIDGQPLVDQTIEKLDQSFYDFLYNLKVTLKNKGLTEVQTYSFYSTAVIDALGWNNEKGKFLVKVANPISTETEYLRQSIWPNLLEVVVKNLRKGYADIAIFEIGKAFNVGPDGIPVEDYRLAMALSNGTDNPLQELYQIAQDLIPHLEGITLNSTKPPAVATNLFHPNRFMAFKKDGKQIGGLAEVHLRVLNKLGIEKRVAILEIDN